MLKRCLILLCLLALTACATDPFAKSPAAGSGALAGQLTGDATRPYAVLILPAGQGFAMAWTSAKAYPDEDGDFLLPDLAPGQYVLAGFSDGQRPYWFNRKTGAARCVTVRLEWTEDRSAADVLGRLRTKTGDPAWAAMIGKTLSALPDPAPSRPTPDCSQAR